jgi:hypothetical protein
MKTGSLSNRAIRHFAVLVAPALHSAIRNDGGSLEIQSRSLALRGIIHDEEFDRRLILVFEGYPDV